MMCFHFSSFIFYFPQLFYAYSPQKVIDRTLRPHSNSSSLNTFRVR